MSKVINKFYPNGSLFKLITYKNDKLDGIFKIWYRNGSLCVSSNYSEGKRDGLSQEWYKNGKFKKESIYSNGFLNGKHKKWYENGQLKLDSLYSGNLLDGNYKEYYENGNLKLDCSYIKGLLNGMYREYYENGKLKIDTTYLLGFLKGEYIEYDEEEKIKVSKSIDMTKELLIYDEINYDDILNRSNLKYLYHIFWEKEVNIMKDITKIFQCRFIYGRLYDIQIIKKNTSIVQKEIHKIYYKNGNFSYLKMLNSNLILEKEWYENGNLKKESTLKFTDLIHLETSKEWYENGQLKKNYNRNGFGEYFYDTGIVHKKGYYKNGKLNGLFHVYNRKGEIIVTAQYKDGARCL